MDRWSDRPTAAKVSRAAKRNPGDQAPMTPISGDYSSQPDLTPASQSRNGACCWSLETGSSRRRQQWGLRIAAYLATALAAIIPEVHFDEDGVWVIECPSIPGCVSQGGTKGEALDNIKDAIAACLVVRSKRGMPLTVETHEVEVVG